MARLLRWALGAGAGAAAYSLYEPLRFRLESREVPVRWAGPPLDVLHLADTHLAPQDRKLQSFLRSLPDRLDRVPDLVVATGDMIEGSDGIQPLLDAIAGVKARFGRFYVLGSHDYYEPAGPSYTKYFSGKKPKRQPRPADSARLERGLQDAGWIALTNRSEIIEVHDRRVRLAGVDDPYLNRHDVSHIARAETDQLALALVHAPDVVSQWALNGFDVIFAGHTHAGQVRIPLLGAAVTNSSLPAALAGGLNRIGDTWLHVSPGLGTGRFTPIRFLTPPETTLLRLVPTALG
ncbi:MAG: metallophosphoesterase [Actinomycetota bacterium]|nr:metallophosphoesterase [Actinomycetota bacterium]